MLAAQRPIARQWANRAGMQKHQARLAELGLPYGQQAAVQVHIDIIQLERLGDPQSGRRQQPEQRRIGGGTKAIWRSKLAGGFEQRHDLGVAIDVRGHSARKGTEA